MFFVIIQYKINEAFPRLRNKFLLMQMRKKYLQLHQSQKEKPEQLYLECHTKMFKLSWKKDEILNLHQMH